MEFRAILIVTMLVLFPSCGRDSGEMTAAAQDSPAANKVATPAAKLYELDERAPVPLVPMMANRQKSNMRGYLVAVQEILAALASEDYAGVEKAAKRIGFSEEMKQMCSRMGSAAPPFAEQALEFHHTADQIMEAAQAKDHARVLNELSATLQKCTSCHAVWKQQVVDEATWQRKASAMSPTNDHSTHQ